MTDEELNSDYVDFPCPNCGENRSDFLVWLDDEFVQCASCGHMYQPGSREQDKDAEQEQ